MKHLIYICSLLLISFFMVGCEDENSLNTLGEATVSMGQANYNVKENKGIFLVPIHVSGDRNGAVEVDVEVKSNDPACVEDEHFLVTSKHIIIPHDKSVGYVEIKAVDDRVINTDRVFTINIIKVQGAQLNASNRQTMVTLLDNDNIPYDRMNGTWVVTATDMLQDMDASKVSWETRLTTVADEEGEGYGSVIVMSPWRMWSGDTFEDVLNITHNLIFRYNEASQTATLELKLGQIMAEGFILGGENEDGLDLTSCTMRSAMPTAMSYTTNGTITGKVNDDFTQITFNLPMMGLLYDANNTPFSYWFYYSDIVLTRK